ncbi:MAG: hypothetical protein ACR2K6_01710, partial [Solirubrobacterales bacterium]
MPVLAILAFIILFPVVTIGPFTDALEGRGDLLRAGFLVGMLGLAALVWGPGIPRPAARLRAVVAGLLVLAGFGAVSALANATSAQTSFSLAAQLVGQPLVMAGLLIYLSAFLRSGGRATDYLLAAFALGVVAEAAVVAGELWSGAAYDELREFTRAQGTVGANFLGAYAMMALFIGLAGIERGGGLRSRRPDRRPESAGAPRLSGPRMTRAVGAVTIGAAAVIIVGAVARSALIGVVI